MKSKTQTTISIRFRSTGATHSNRFNSLLPKWQNLQRLQAALGPSSHPQLGQCLAPCTQDLEPVRPLRGTSWWQRAAKMHTVQPWHAFFQQLPVLRQIMEAFKGCIKQKGGSRWIKRILHSLTKQRVGHVTWPHHFSISWQHQLPAPVGTWQLESSPVANPRPGEKLTAGGEASRESWGD